MPHPVKAASVALVFALTLALGSAVAAPVRDDLAGVMSQVAGEVGASLASDDALQRTADAIARATLDGRSGGLLAFALGRAEGLRDPSLYPVTLTFDEVPPASALRPVLAAADVPWARATHGAVGIASRGGRTAVCFLAAERQARFAGDLVHLPQGTVAARLLVTNPLGQVERRELLPRKGASFVLDNGIEDLAGAWVFELEAVASNNEARLAALWTVTRDRPRPKEPVAADNPLGLGPGGMGGVTARPSPRSPDAWMVRAGDAPDRAPTVDDANDVEAHLRAILATHRRVLRLPTLTVDAALTRVARARATAASQGEPASEPVANRLVAAGLAPLSAEEVLLTARDPTEALEVLLGAPESRALLLSPRSDSFGIGLTLQGRAGDWSLVVTAIRAELGEGGSLRDVFLEHVGRGREAARVGALLFKGPLDAVAARAASLVAPRGAATLSDAERSGLVGEVRAALPDTRGVAFEVLFTADPSSIATRRRVAESRWSEAGLAVGDAGEAGFVTVLVLVER